MATAGVADSIGWWSRVQPRLWFAPAALAFSLALVSDPTIAIDSWMRVHVDTVAWLAFVAAAGLRWWAALTRAADPHALATTGPYSVCRNPMMIANLLFGMSLALFLASATFAIGFLIGAIGWFSTVVAAEEHILARHFGVEYRRYCREVPRFRIRFRNFQSLEMLSVCWRDLIDELRLTALWMWLPVVGKLLAQLRAENWWPHLLRLP
jgi:protein-S-isoprenylcysteine O-methyltransferase Ste14